jgi:hypothetical protein
MRRLLIGILVGLVVVAIATQLALPRYLSGRTEDRLEEGGGSSKVTLRAFPALTLVGGRGGSIEVFGADLSFDAGNRSADAGNRRERPFERLDGFEQVEVGLDDLEAGPLAVDRFELERDGRHEAYRLVVRATTTPRKLAGEVGTEAGGALGGLVGSLASGILPGGPSDEVPLELTATLDSDDGRTDVREATGSVAGVPAGPLTEVVVSAVLERL